MRLWALILHYQWVWQRYALLTFYADYRAERGAARSLRPSQSLLNRLCRMSTFVTSSALVKDRQRESKRLLLMLQYIYAYYTVYNVCSAYTNINRLYRLLFWHAVACWPHLNLLRVQNYEWPYGARWIKSYMSYENSCVQCAFTPPPPPPPPPSIRGRSHEDVPLREQQQR